MTPKEKAGILFHSYFDLLPLEAQISDTTEIANDKCVNHYQLAKSCAIIAVDEILKAVDGKYDEYWEEVKKELENY